MEFIEKIGDYKKEMKRFIKGLVKSKLFQDEDGNLIVVIEKIIEKTSDKEKKFHTVVLTCSNAAMSASLRYEVTARIYNKVDPTLFESLGSQLAKSKNFGQLIIK